MDFLELIQKRRSVRRFSDQRVPREIVERCLEAARWAPSACNSQPWEFIITDTEPTRSRLAHAAFSGTYKINEFAMAAPVLIAIVTQRSKFIARLGGQLRGI